MSARARPQPPPHERFFVPAIACLGTAGPCGVSLPWRRGDLLITDNIIMAQGRSAIEGSPEFLIALGTR